MKLMLGRIADLIHAEGDFATNVEAVGYSIDSRTIAAEELFFAVRGESVDGHDYVEAALANGAAAAVVSMRWLASDEMDGCKLLRVPEEETDCVLQSMQRLARVGGEDDDQGGGGAGAGRAVYGAEVGGEFEQSFWLAAAVAEVGYGARGSGAGDGDEPRGRDCRAGKDRGA